MKRFERAILFLVFLFCALGCGAANAGGSSGGFTEKNAELDPKAGDLLVSMGTVQNPPSIDEKEIAWFDANLPDVRNELSGKFFFANGAPVKNATVYLFPVCPYTAWLIGKILHYERSGAHVNVDPLIYSKYMIVSRTDDEGYFFRQHLVAGNYYVLSLIEEDSGTPVAIDGQMDGVAPNAQAANVIVPALDFSKTQRTFFMFYRNAIVPDWDPGVSFGTRHPSVFDSAPLNPNLPKFAGIPYDFRTLHSFATAVQPTQAEVAPYLQKGNGKISGTVNLQLQGTHSPLLYPGANVYLMPAQPWAYAAAQSDATFAAQHMTTFAWQKWMASYTRVTKADAQGRFVFDHLPPGKYVVDVVIQANDGKNVNHSVGIPEQTTVSVEHYAQEGERGEDNKVHEQNERYYTEEEQQKIYLEHYSTFEGCVLSAAAASIVTLKENASVSTPLAVIGGDVKGQCPN